MKQAIKVTANEEGNVVNVSLNNPEYGYIRIAQKTSSFNADGWLKTEDRSFLFKGPLEDLQSVGLQAGDIIPGNLVRVETLNPESEEAKPKVAGDTGVICKKNGQPIYSSIKYDQSGTDVDQLIAHDNREEIIAALASSKPSANDYAVTTEAAFEAPQQEEKVQETVIEETVSEIAGENTDEEIVEEVVEEVVEDATEEVQELDLETDFVL